MIGAVTMLLGLLLVMTIPEIQIRFEMKPEADNPDLPLAMIAAAKDQGYEQSA